jgi:hypothetical protein
MHAHNYYRKMYTHNLNKIIFYWSINIKLTKSSYLLYHFLERNIILDK